MSRKKYTVLSLFSGAMGLDLGLEKTGRYKFVACVEKEPIFCETIRLNRDSGRLPKKLKVFEGGVEDFCPKEIMEELGLKPGELDLLVGGPPCQAFSTAGKRQSVEDPRGTLLWQFLKYVEVFQPKVFLMENVRGLISAALKHRPIAERPEKGGKPLSEEEKPGSVIRLFAKDLQNLNDSKYHMDVFEVNSVNYGAPQIRERVLFVGNRFNRQIEFPNPTHGQANGVSNSVQNDLFSEAVELKPWSTLRDAIGNLNEESPEVLDFSPRKKSYLQLVPEGGNWRTLPEDVQKESMGRAYYAKGGRSGWWRRLTYDLPCPTLVTMPNHASTSICHPKETRALSVKEYARIQEFPENWEFAGSTSKKYTQIGNAVPTRLGEVAGDVISEQLGDLYKTGFRKKRKPLDEFRVVYIQSHVRTRKWFDGKDAVLFDKDKEEASYSAPKTLRKSKAIG